MPLQLIMHVLFIHVRVLGDDSTSESLDADHCSSLVSQLNSLSSTDNTLYDDDINDVKLISHLTHVASPGALNGDCTVQLFIGILSGADATIPGLDCNDTRQTIHGYIESKKPTNNALYDCNAVQIFKDMHCCEVPSSDTLDLGGTVMVVFQA